MAVPFHVPEAASSPPTAPSPTTTSTGSVPQTPQPHNGGATAQHSPLLSPVNSEYLVQAFCEALYRYSRVQGGSPGYQSMTSPPSPSSCNGNGGVFFNFNSLRNPRTDDFYGSPRAARARSHSLTTPSRIRLSSQGHELTDDEDDSTDENFSEPNHLIQEHYNYMTLRENMQEFPGRVPQRKRKSKEMENSQQDSSKPKEPKFAWPLFALGVLAVGCGLFATR